MTIAPLRLSGAIVLVASLAACSGSTPPIENPTIADATSELHEPTPPGELAKTQFAEVFADYELAKRDGLSSDECERLAGRYDEIYAAHPSSMPIARFNAGALWQECGDEAKATAIYRELADQNFHLALTNLGVIAWEQGDHQAALALFERSVEAAKMQAFWARNNLAAAHRERYADSANVQDFASAERQIQNVLAVDSSNAAAYENLARLYYDRGRIEDASYLVLANLVVTQALRVLEQEQVESADLWNLRGLLFMQDDNQVDALRAFQKAVEIDAKHPDANRNIGFIAIRFRDYRQAEQAFATALESAEVERDIEVYLALGVAKRGLEEFEAAEACYRKAIELDEQDPRAWYNLGILHQDHLTSRDGMEQPDIEKLYGVAKDHYGKFIAAAQTDQRFAAAVTDAKDRVAIIDDAIEAFREMDAAQTAADAAMREAERIEKERREKLLELERAAAAAGAPSVLDQLDAEAAVEAAKVKAEADAEKQRAKAEADAKAEAADAE